jgi:hypothetical protein
MGNTKKVSCNYATRWKLIISLEGTLGPREQDCDWVWCSCFVFRVNNYDFSCILNNKVRMQWKDFKGRGSSMQYVLLYVAQGISF